MDEHEPTQVNENPEIPFGNPSSLMDMNDTAAAVTAKSLSKFDRHVVLVSSRFKQPSNASPYDNVRKMTEDQVARKQQKDTFEHSAHKSYATIDPVDTPDDQITRPTVEKSNDKSILTYRKPPDSTNSAIDVVRTNVINESTREHTVCHPNTIGRHTAARRWQQRTDPQRIRRRGFSYGCETRQQ